MEAPVTLENDMPTVALCHAHADLKRHLPDFLIISPPKTGSTWLAANLQRHQDVFIARMKEVKYFSTYHRWLGLDWYAGHFADGGSRLKGEASPSYALLPCRMIRWLRSLVPHVKLIFLMRDPIARAWSHARHNYRYREANFEAYTGDVDLVPEERWRENFRHPWPLASGDYLGQLQRWLSVFPKEQIHVDLYERLATEPEALLLRVLAFLGADTHGIDWTAYRMRETILPGVDKTLPGSLVPELQLLLRARTRRLEGFLREHFSLCVREAWAETLAPGAEGASGGEATPADAVFTRAFDDEFLGDLLETEVHSSDPQLLREGYHGYNLVLHRGRFLALAQALGEIRVEGLHALVARGQETSGIFLGASLAHLKEKVADQVIHALAARQATTDQETAALQARVKALEGYRAEMVLVARLRGLWAFRLCRALARCLKGGLAASRVVLGKARPQAARALPPVRLDPHLSEKPS